MVTTPITIDYGRISFTVRDEATLKRLEPLDRDGNRKIDHTDVPPVYADLDVGLLEMTAQVLFPTSFENTSSYYVREILGDLPQRRNEGFKRFVRAATDLKQTASDIADVRKSIQNTGFAFLNTEFEYSPADWPRIQRIVSQGSLSSEHRQSLTAEIAAALILFSGDASQSALYDEGGFELYYNQNAVPPYLRDIMFDLAHRYSFDAQWLKTHKGKELECDGDEACPDDELRVPWMDFDKIVPSTEASWRKFTGDIPACFTKGAALLVEGGGSITFEQLADLQHDEWPKVASFDVASQQIVYQQPEAVISSYSDMLVLDLEGERGEHFPLEVTADHPLRVERGDYQFWLTTGALKEGDNIVGPQGSRFTYRAAAKMEGFLRPNVYNLTFASETTGKIPTYLVSPDGEHWIVAHNTKE